MKVRWYIDMLVFAACLAGLLAGAVLWLLGHRTPANWVWAAAAVPAVLSLLQGMIAALRRREIGVDLLALVSIVGAIALHQNLTAAVIAVMLASGRLLESYAERRAGREMSALLARVPRTVNRYTDGQLTPVPLAAVKAGDRLLVRHGEVVPVDGTLIAARAVLDEAALTGESVPVAYERGAWLRSGTLNAADSFDLLASASAADSTFAGIVKLVEAAQRSRAPATRLADRYALWFIPVTLALAAIAWAASGDALRALAVVVVATPCPLILAVPVAMVSGMSRCAKRGILVKGGAALETLAGARTLFFDKTGTLTGGEARLVEIKSTTAGNENELLATAASLEQMSHHVIAAAVVRAAQARGLALRIPKDVVETVGAGMRGTLDGTRVAAGSLDYLARIAPVPTAVRELLERAGTEGTSAVLVAIDGKFSGVLLLADQIRMETPRALRLLRRAGFRRIVMLTGDRRDVAEAIGSGLGVDEVLAEQTPAHKLEMIKAARSAGPTVMVGDGVNDAPALAAASVGVAMGARGATASAEAADIVLLVDRLDRLAEALHIARETRAIAVQSVLAGMAASVLAMLVAAAGYLPPLYGAVLQEIIDVAVILNALRALRIHPLRASRHNLTPDESERLRTEHATLTPVLDRLTAVADRLPTLPHAEVPVVLKELDALLQQQLLPHERADDRQVYPAVAALLGGDDPMAAMSRTHREIFRLHQQFSSLITRLPAQGPDAEALRDLQRILHALDAILRLHFAQEEEIYQSLAHA
ncbi:MAG TPA: heavy metal translocating P-type ATPase [Gammaproteobacteria bacterium]|nr:heavy metal translocating P-type ATPase [Gammaproteobacteria bacterium]